MLTVVQHQQKLFLRKDLDEAVLQRLSAPIGRMEYLGNSLGDAGLLGHGCQLDEPDPFPVAGKQVGGDLNRQAGLADSAHSGERHHARITQGRGDTGHFSLAPNERADLSG